MVCLETQRREGGDVGDGEGGDGGREGEEALRGP